MRLYFVVVFLCSCFIARSSTDSVLVSGDTTILPFEVFLNMVNEYHPLAKQARLQEAFGKAEMRAARGNFDPKLEANWDKKEFDNKNYYDIFRSSIKVPTYFPIDPKFEVSRAEGQFVNQENRIPEKNDFLQLTAGVSIPIGQGLFTDARRTAYQQAQVFQNVTRAEQAKMLNKLMLDASSDYWSWFYTHNQLKLIQLNITISEEILRRVRLDYEYGEASGMDTIQASINNQSLWLELQEVENEWIANTMKLGTYLWDNDQPVELKSTTVPEKWSADNLIMLDINLPQLMTGLEQHPELLKLRLKNDQLNLENRLNREYLKPQIDLNYNFINSPINPDGEYEQPSFNENYKFGVDFSFPLFLRKERGKILKTDLKIESNTFDLQTLRREIEANITSLYEQLVNANAMVERSLQLTNNYQRLLNAEFINLQNGESDLFKINIQQEKFLNAQIKLLKSQSNFQKRKAYLIYAAGYSPLVFE